MRCSGLIDEVAIWKRVLSPDEILLLQSGYITNPPSRTALFIDCRSDRTLNSLDEYTTDYPSDLINRLYLVGNSDTYGALFDDMAASRT